MAVSHKLPSVALLSIFGLNHVLRVRSFALNIIALHLNISEAPSCFLLKHLF